MTIATENPLRLNVFWRDWIDRSQER